jgi:hypothetical protein
MFSLSNSVWPARIAELAGHECCLSRVPLKS